MSRFNILFFTSGCIMLVLLFALCFFLSVSDYTSTEVCHYLNNKNLIGVIFFALVVVVISIMIKINAKNTILCPYCLGEIDSKSIKCNHCKSMLQFEYSGRTEYWDATLYFIIDNGKPAIQQWAVADFALYLMMQSEDLYGAKLIMLHRDKIKKLVSEMPINVRADFLKCLSEFTIALY
ncbi:TPA: hypothetical protein PGG59_005266 [Raoultella planticola]|nr:hypothetical protein [Raoultella planticola]